MLSVSADSLRYRAEQSESPVPRLGLLHSAPLLLSKTGYACIAAGDPWSEEERAWCCKRGVGPGRAPRWTAAQYNGTRCVLRARYALKASL